MLPSRTVRPNFIGSGNKKGLSKGDFFSIPGTYQAALSPRNSGGVGFGANVRYNPPSYENMAVPCDPLRYANMAKNNYSRENFTTTEAYGCGSCGGGCFSADCMKGGASKSFKAPPTCPSSPGACSDYAAGNYNEMVGNVMQSASAAPATVSQLPVGDMTTVNAMGEEVQPIVFERLIYANRNSRLRSQGDWIRGDLPITPCNTGWFQVSVDPNVDLNQGAMNVLGGLNNDTTQALSALINDYTGDTTLAGINMTPSQLSSIGAGRNDLNVTAFP